LIPRFFCRRGADENRIEKAPRSTFRPYGLGMDRGAFSIRLSASLPGTAVRPYMKLRGSISPNTAHHFVNHTILGMSGTRRPVFPLFPVRLLQNSPCLGTSSQSLFVKALYRHGLPLRLHIIKVARCCSILRPPRYLAPARLAAYSGLYKRCKNP
jgi:hypothetical protein